MRTNIKDGVRNISADKFLYVRPEKYAWPSTWEKKIIHVYESAWSDKSRIAKYQTAFD